MKFDNTDQRRVFMGMARPDQLATLWDQDSYLRSELAKKDAQIITAQEDIRNIKAELLGIGRRHVEDTMSTTDKFDAMMSKRRDWGSWFIDRVLPQIVTLITLAVLAITFGKNLLP